MSTPLYSMAFRTLFRSQLNVRRPVPMLPCLRHSNVPRCTPCGFRTRRARACRCEQPTLSSASPEAPAGVHSFRGGFCVVLTRRRSGPDGRKERLVVLLPMKISRTARMLDAPSSASELTMSSPSFTTTKDTRRTYWCEGLETPDVTDRTALRFQG